MKSSRPCLGLMAFVFLVPLAVLAGRIMNDVSPAVVIRRRGATRCIRVPRGGGGESNVLNITKNDRFHDSKESVEAITGNFTDANDAISATPNDTSKRPRSVSLLSMFGRNHNQRRKRHSKRSRRKREIVKNHTLRLTIKMNEKLEEARRMFLDRMAAVSFNLINYEQDAKMNSDSFFESDGSDDDVTPQSDLSLPNRSIYVVTTAALPWKTGTAVNPLLRAAYLSRRAKAVNEKSAAVVKEFSHDANDNTTSAQYNSTKQWVTLLIPWLELVEDRIELYGSENKFDTMQEQESYIRDWLRKEANMAEEADPIEGLRILFYPARYHSGMNSIFAMGDIICALRNQTDDNLSDAVCILEEPEHLNWYRAPGEGWTKVFNYVVGVVHTNYIEYASTQFHGLWTAPAIQVMSSAMIRAYCHKVIKLSGVLQTYAPEKEVIENVHGVREDFIREGRLRAKKFSERPPSSTSLNEEAEGQVYFIGKILWAKGFDNLLELEDFYHECTGKFFSIDIYGGGPDQLEIKRAFHGRRSGNQTKVHNKKIEIEDSQISWEFLAKKYELLKSSSLEFDLPKSFHELRRKPIPANFMGPVDHALLGKYKVFVNPSVSEVLCTTTFEALAMGKFVIIPVHESNKFFLQFPNCLGYRNKWEFAASLRWALTHEPEPLTQELAKSFTWEAATERLIKSSAITRREATQRAMLGTARLDERIAFFHRELGKGTKGDALRKFLGGGPISDQVKYEMAKQGMDQDDSDDEGLSRKFHSSSLVRAIKSSFSGLVSQDANLYAVSP